MKTKHNVVVVFAWCTVTQDKGSTDTVILEFVSAENKSHCDLQGRVCKCC